jgi:hypothetical protein
VVVEIPAFIVAGVTLHGALNVYALCTARAPARHGVDLRDLGIITEIWIFVRHWT